MKHIFFLLYFLSFQAHADLKSCMQDARDFGYKLNERRGTGCRELVKADPKKVEATSLSGRYQILALGNLLYVDTLSGREATTHLKRDILAGDQTDLKNIKKVWIHEKKKRFLVLQGGEPYGLLTYGLESVSNTAPLRHFVSPILNNANSVKLLDDRDEIAIMSASAQSIRFINSGADTVRYKGGDFKPLLLREIMGEHSQLLKPMDVVISNDRNEIYVLDTGRILIFDLKSVKETRPKKILTAPVTLKSAVGIELGTESDSLQVHLSSGQSVKISVK